MLRRISGLLLSAIVPAGITSSFVFPASVSAQSSPPASDQSAPSVISLLPTDTAAVLMLNTTPEAWRELDRFNPYPGFFPPDFLGPLLQVEMKSETEVQSWIGDRAAIALLPATADTASWEAHTVGIVASRDPFRLRSFVDRFKAQRGQPQIERAYKGVTIIQWVGDKPPSVEPPVPSQVVPKETWLPGPLLGLTPADQLKAAQSPPLKPAPRPLPPKPSPTPESPSPDQDDDPTDPPSPRPSSARKSRSLAIALLPNHLIIANQGDALEKLIDAQTETSTLAQSPKFQRTLQHPQFRRSLLVGYGNVAGLLPFLAPFTRAVEPSKPTPEPLPSQNPTKNPPPPKPTPDPLPSQNPAKNPPNPPGGRGSGSSRPTSPPPTPAPFGAFDRDRLEQLKKDYSTIDFLTWVQPQGIRTQSHSYYASPKPEVATVAVPNPNQVVGRLPAATYLSANSYNFKRQWGFFLKTIEGDTSITTPLQKFRTEFTKQTQLDLEQDVIAWMDKEYVLTMFPAAQGLFNTTFPGFNLEAGLLIQTSDRPKAEATLKKLAQAAKTGANGTLEVVDRTIQGQPITSWETKSRGQTVSVLSYAWSGDTLILATGAGAMAPLYPKPYLPLNLNYTFKTATQGFATPNEGFLYVNMGSSLALLYNLLFPKGSPAQGSSYVQEIQRVMGIFRSYSTSNTITPDGEQLDSMLILSPRKQP